MRLPAVLFVAAVSWAGNVHPSAGQAAEPNECALPDSLSYTDGRLRHAAHTITTQKKLDILVVGSGSSSLGGPEGQQTAYPARLEAALKRRLPGIAVTVRTDIKPRRSAEDMEKAFDRILLDAKPDLVLWQTGTVDAIRNVDPDAFRATLEEGVQTLQAGGVDVLLVNMQYSPRTELMIAAGAYADTMRWIAQHYELPLLDRLSIMRHWSESGVFDFTADTKSRIAERVHDCLGKLLAEMIVNTGNIHVTEAKEKR
jgi:hypothetical protein